MASNHETMTPRSRVLAGIFGGRVDRSPVGSTMSVATHEQMDKLGVGFPEAHYEPEAMAKLASASYEIIGMDTIKVPFSVWNLSSSLGTTMNWGSRNKWPDGVPIFRDPEEVKIPKDFLSRPGTGGVIEAIKILRRKYPHVAIIGTVMGPLTQCFNLVGVEKVMLMIATEPNKIKRFLEKFIDPVVEYANAQVDAGIDALDYADHATGGLISAETYKEFIMPMHKRIVQEIKTPCVLHICGNTLDRLEYIIESGFPCFNIDTWVDAFHAKRVAKNRISLWGGISNINSLLPSCCRCRSFSAWAGGLPAQASRMRRACRSPHSARSSCHSGSATAQGFRAARPQPDGAWRGALRLAPLKKLEFVSLSEAQT